MKRKEFHILLTNATCLSREEAKSLISLEKEFPYSQVIHSLAARAAQDNQLPDKEEQLHLGAIYTADRAVFKAIMTATVQERKSDSIADSLNDDSYNTASSKTEILTDSISQVSVFSETLIASEIKQNQVTYPTNENEVVVNDAFYEEIRHDLDRLKELRHEFEETVKQLENGTISPTNSDVDLKKKKSIDPTDELLTEIKSSKKKIKPDGPKQKEQIEIIDQFIKTQPSIKGKVSSEEKSQPKDDLSEKSLSYNEHIISETLAEILIKQGKKEKAIEVLKKLIWKFPQKKAYFAAQIEDLKK